MSPRYAELRCRSSFSFLTGASQPEELVDRAADLGLEALALADRGGLYGVVRAHARARKRGIPLVVGAELSCDGLGSGATGLTLLAMDREGYAGLCRLLTEAHAGAPLGDGEAPEGTVVRPPEPRLPFLAVADRSRGLLALHAGADAGVAARLREVFGGRLALTVSRHRSAGEETRITAVRSVGRRLSIPVAVTNDVHTHDRRRQPLQDVLTCIRLGTSVDRVGRRLFPNAERTMKGPEEMARLWTDFPEGLETAADLAASCPFRLEEIRGEHPLPPVLAAEGDAAGAMGLLRRLVREGAVDRYGGPPPADVERQLARELALVEQLGYESYFLTVWDVVRFARERGILCQGRGSAANSAICFVLGITSIDPVRMGLLFERFLSAERGEPPDIDVDFEHERREEVIQYVYGRYGRDRAGMVCEVIAYRARSAIRDVGKALGLAPDQVDRLAKLVGSHDTAGKIPVAVLEQAGLDPEGSPAVRHALCLSAEIAGFPRHLSIHVGGFVITKRPLVETVPVQPAAMAGRTVVQWDKDDLAELGLLKVDLLALGMLTALSRSLALLERHRPAPLGATADPWPASLAAIPAEEPEVYEMISRADTIGVFQIESRAQMALLPRLRPRRFYDLVISVAIIRPGPIQGGMVHPFLRRRDGREEVRYPYEPLRAVLERTLGIPLFQEQAMRLAVVAAGYTPGEADELRRAMTHKRSHERIEEMRGRLVTGMAAKGIPPADADAILQQLHGFAGYGFPESHAASFALLVYASAWVKRHHPAAFVAALLDSQPMGFYAPHTLVEDAKRHGVEVRGVDVAHSEWQCTLEGVAEGVPAGPGERPALRLGLGRIRGLPRAVGEAVLAARGEAPFVSVEDLARRARLSRAWLARLAEAAALRSLAPGRRSALWTALGLSPGNEADLFAGRLPPEARAIIEEPAAAEEVARDYAVTGLSERAHPVSFLRAALAARGARTARELTRLRDRAAVEVGGIVIVRQRPETARGITFVSLEDETGIANLVVMPDVYERFRPLVRNAPFLIARGRVERTGAVVNLQVRELLPLEPLQEVRTASRDFH